MKQNQELILFFCSFNFILNLFILNYELKSCIFVPNRAISKNIKLKIDGYLSHLWRYMLSEEDVKQWNYEQEIYKVFQR